LVCGGERIGTEGYFVQPTVFADVDNSMAIAREEIFGPVGVFIRFETAEEAIAIANDSDFGLAAGIWTDSLDTTVFCTEKLEVRTALCGGTRGACCCGGVVVVGPFPCLLL
jgi:aldehyde dehydrogenase (NAD+)